MTAPTAVTTAGLVSGVRERGAIAFKGVPYAEAPIGHLRYSLPQAPRPWEGVRPCGTTAPRSMQGSARRGQAAVQLRQSEDCLYLNVWTPALDGARPVVVYVHGGGYVLGSGSEDFQAGDAYAGDDVILVTFNHRLSALGFLHIDELFDGLEGTGNLGLYDTIRVLEWVQDNIASFGGDPARVTIAGHSSGGVTITALLASPLARGLFRGAIPISSASGHSWIESDTATAVARTVLESLDIVAGDLDGLLGRPAESLVLAPELLHELYSVAGGHPFSPVVDGRLLSGPPIEAIRDGAGADVDLLVGHMDEEFRLCIFDDNGQVRNPPLNMGVTSDGFEHWRLAAATGLPSDAVLEVYERSLQARGREVSDPEIFSMMASDVVMLNPGAALAVAHQAQRRGATWAYRFAWRPPAGGGKVGACHGIDIPYFFEHLDAPFWAPLYQGQGNATLATRYRKAMTSMATTGSPGHADLPVWPPYSADRRATMVFAEECAVVDDPDGDRRRLWDNAPPYGYPGSIGNR